MPTPLSGNLERRVIVVCAQGYESSLVADPPQRLGFPHAADLDGGFQAS